MLRVVANYGFGVFFSWGVGGGGYGGHGYSEERSSARRVADHYSARSNQTLEERENSPIIHLKKLNNWVFPSYPSTPKFLWRIQMSIDVWYNLLSGRPELNPSNLDVGRLRVFWSSSTHTPETAFLIWLVERWSACGELVGNIMTFLVKVVLTCFNCFDSQGGDLIKWDKAKVGYYVGVDIAEGSVSFLSRDICTICIQLIVITWYGVQWIICLLMILGNAYPVFAFLPR